VRTEGGDTGRWLRAHVRGQDGGVEQIGRIARVGHIRFGRRERYRLLDDDGGRIRCDRTLFL
jgi:hypothetical protein